MDYGLIIRMVASIIVWVHGILATSGTIETPFTDDTLYIVASILAMIVMLAIMTWKNNNFTKSAKLAQKILSQLKSSGLLNKHYADSRMDMDDIAACVIELMGEVLNDKEKKCNE